MVLEAKWFDGGASGCCERAGVCHPPSRAAFTRLLDPSPITVLALYDGNLHTVHLKFPSDAKLLSLG